MDREVANCEEGLDVLERPLIMGWWRSLSCEEALYIMKRGFTVGCRWSLSRDGGKGASMEGVRINLLRALSEGGEGPFT